MSRTCEFLVTSGALEQREACVVAVCVDVNGEVLRQRERLAAFVARVLRSYTHRAPACHSQLLSWHSTTPTRTPTTPTRPTRLCILTSGTRDLLARKSTSVSVSASWNASFTTAQHCEDIGRSLEFIARRLCSAVFRYR